MELIQNNPYRIAGILSNASERELQKQKQKQKIKAYSKVGKGIKSDYDFQVLNNITRTEDSIDRAFSKIEQNQDKINFALFWFLSSNSFDKTAIEYLKIGNEGKAIEIWEKITLNKQVNSKNFSAYNNLGTYKLLSQSKDVVKEGIEAKITLIESEFFENFVHAVADETFTIDNEKQIKILVDELLTQFKNQYLNSEIIQLFSGCKGTTQQYLTKTLTEIPIHNIESQIEKTKNKRKENKSEAYQYVLKIGENCKDDLVLLKSILGTSNLKYKTIADQLANEIMQCGIDYFNEKMKHDSSGYYLESTLKLIKIADRIAVGKLTKDRIKENLTSLEEMKEQEIDQAILLLKTIKNAYNKNKQEIMIQVEIQKYSLPYKQSINYNKVNELIANCIDWDKAIDLIVKTIPKTSIERIKNVQNSFKINQYKELVDFLFDKLGYNHWEKVDYLIFWSLNWLPKLSTREIISLTVFVIIFVAVLSWGYYTDMLLEYFIGLVAFIFFVWLKSG